MVDLSPSFSKVREQFKFSELNKHQKEAIISAVLKKKDVFVSLPTGFGKSVIFQALSMVFDGFTGESGHIVIIVSPLLKVYIIPRQQTKLVPLRPLGRLLAAKHKKIIYYQYM